VLALKEIRRYQRTTNLFIQKAPFIRVVKEITEKCGFLGLRFRVEALEVLQEAAEGYLTGLFEDSNLCGKISIQGSFDESLGIPL
jgi:histone H3